MPRPFFPNIRIYGATPVFGTGVQKLLETLLWVERVPASAELSVNFIRLSEMQALNYERREIDKPTDVLTFPGSGSGTLDECWVNEVLLFPSQHDNDDTNVDNCLGRLKGTQPRQRMVLMDLGNIYFCVEHVWHRCSRYPQSNLRFHDYLQAALVHATLHALGYDHDTPERWKKMSRREKFLAHYFAARRRRWPGCLTELDGIELLNLIGS